MYDDNYWEASACRIIPYKKTTPFTIPLGAAGRLDGNLSLDTGHGWVVAYDVSVGTGSDADVRLATITLAADGTDFLVDYPLAKYHPLYAQGLTTVSQIRIPPQGQITVTGLSNGMVADVEIFVMMYYFGARRDLKNKGMTDEDLTGGGA